MAGMATDELRKNRMMRHLLAALERGEDIGHYGRLVFAMVARHFIDEPELRGFLERNLSADEALALCEQVKAHDYSPPRRARILDWQRQQAFPICPDAKDPDACNVYKDLKFPQQVYDHIEEYYEEKASGDDLRSDSKRSLVDVDDRHEQREHERSDQEADESERFHSA